MSKVVNHNRNETHEEIKSAYLHWSNGDDMYIDNERKLGIVNGEEVKELREDWQGRSEILLLHLRVAIQFARITYVTGEVETMPLLS